MVICFTKLLLSEKHELSRIWLAAHWEKKINRTQIFDFDIVKSVHDIMEAEFILDLRISGHLLVGIVKIHSRKTKYLLTECSSILYQVKIYHAGRIDLPENMQTASVDDITLTEFFSQNFENCGGDIIDAILKSNQSQLEDITLKETSEKLTLLDDDMRDFIYHEGDEPFDFAGENAITICNDLEISNNETSKKKVDAEDTNTLVCDRGNLAPPTDQDEFDIELLNSNNLVNEVPDSTGKDMPHIMNADADHFLAADDFVTSHIQENNEALDKLKLEPVKSFDHNVRKNKNMRKRKLSGIDYIKCMPEETIKKQVLDTSDIVSVLDMAPSSKRLMNLKEIGSAEMLLRLPGLKLMNPKLLQIYQRPLKTRPCENFESTAEDSSQNSRPKRKISMSQSFSINEFFEEDPLSDIRNNTEINHEQNFYDADTLNPDTETMDVVMEHEACDTLIPEIPLTDESSKKDLQSAMASQERWEYALQGRIIKMLEHLKNLFTDKCVIRFSHLSEKNRKIRVAQKFFCLLMLKKFNVISLRQTEAYGEIFISKDINFDPACSRFCSF